MIEHIGQRMADFVGTTGVKVVRAAAELVPGLEPPKRKKVTPGRAALAAGGALAAGIASSALRRAAASNGSGANRSRSAPAKQVRQAKGAVIDLTDKTRSQLYEMARKADVAGRASMTKDQLVAALSKERRS